MEDRKLWEVQFDASGLENEPYTKHIFQLAFEVGFQYGNSLPPMSIKPVSIFKPVVETNNQLKELICMQNRISMDRCLQMMDQFFKEQMAVQRTYKDIADVNSHCRNWFKSQLLKGNNLPPDKRVNKL